MLFIISLGLGDEKDITVKGLEKVKESDFVYLESYTSVLCGTSVEKLSEFFGKKVEKLFRDEVETKVEDIVLTKAKKSKVSFLVIGDAFSATTHTDLYLRAVKKGIKVEVIHNSSIMTAIGACGIQLYNYGQTVSIPLFTEKWKPESFFVKMKGNHDNGMHTLCLLDIKVKERSLENILKGKDIFEPPYFMTVNEALQQILLIEEKRKDGFIKPSTLCVGMARMGSPSQLIVSGTIEQVLKYDFGAPLHCLVIPCEKILSEVETEILKFYNPFIKNEKDEKKDEKK